MSRKLILPMVLTVAALLCEEARAQSAADGLADAPGRGVARISLMNGDVTMRRGDSGDFVAAAINAPLVTGDRLQTGPNSRAEVQFDSSNLVRMAGTSEVRMADLENRRYLVQIPRGLVTYRVLRDMTGDVEISTPSISVRPLRPGTYRVEVLDDGTTEVTVRDGEADIYTPKGSQRLREGRTLLARGTQAEAEFQTVRERNQDDWDRWNSQRDRQLLNSRSYQYMSRDIYGAEDLDAYGNWMNAPGYGWVWSPTVAPGWAPYRAGRWGWVDYYGWSWISYDPWGWAPYHYGRWMQWGGRWCWWPGAGIGVRTWWRPALVAWFGFGGGGVGIGFGRIGWAPLAPFDPFHPWYGPGFYGGFRNRTFINNTTIINNYNITNVYANARVPGGVTVTDGSGFGRGVGNFRAYSAADGALNNGALIRGRDAGGPDGGCVTV